MTPDQPFDTELLLDHQVWVQALARRLMPDADEAADLAQDTWFAALRRPQPRLRCTRAWLAGIMGNAARLRVRSDARRRARQEVAARPDSVPSVEETVSRAELGRRLAGHVLALEGSYRTVLLLRFYDDLPPRSIAAKLDVSVRTVDSRLARGLAKLRESWQRAEGESGLGALAPLALPSMPNATTQLPSVNAAATAMNAKLALAVTSALGLGLIAVMANRTASDLQTERPLARIEPDARPGEDPGTNRERTTRLIGGGRIDAATEPRTSIPEINDVLGAPTFALHTIRGRVLDSEGRPVGRVQMVFRAGDSGVDEVRSASAFDGTFEMSTAVGDGKVSIDEAGYTAVIQGVVRIGSDVPSLVIVARVGNATGEVVDEFNSPLGGAKIEVEIPENFGGRFEAIFDATSGGEWSTLADAGGRFALQELPIIFGSRLRVTLDGYEPEALDIEAACASGTVLRLKRAQSDSLLVGIVIDAEGMPAYGARVSLGHHSAVTNTAGRFQLDRTGAESATVLTAILCDHLPGKVPADRLRGDGTPEWPATVVVRLGGPPLALAGRVVDQHGAARSGVRIWLDDPTRFGLVDEEGEDIVAQVEFLLDGLDDAHSNWRSVTSDQDGRFRIEGLLDRPYSLQLLETQAFEGATVGPFDAGTEDAVAVLERGPTADLRGRVESSRGGPVEGIRLSLSAPAVGGISLGFSGGSVLSDEDGQFVFQNVSGSQLKLSLRGDDIVPHRIAVPVDFAGSPLKLVVSVRCHLKLDLAATGGADRFRVVDAAGQYLPLYRVSATGVTRSSEWKLVDGKSASLGVQDTAVSVVLHNGDEELRRIPVVLATGEVNVVR